MKVSSFLPALSNEQTGKRKNTVFLYISNQDSVPNVLHYQLFYQKL